MSRSIKSIVWYIVEAKRIYHHYALSSDTERTKKIQIWNASNIFRFREGGRNKQNNTFNNV